jgi:hypothetical protein
MAVIPITKVSLDRKPSLFLPIRSMLLEVGHNTVGRVLAIFLLESERMQQLELAARKYRLRLVYRMHGIRAHGP